MHDSEYQATYTSNEGQGKLVITDCISKGSKCFANSRNWKYSVKESFIWAATWQNQQNDMCAQRRLRSAWASAQSDQSLRSALNG